VWSALLVLHRLGFEPLCQLSEEQIAQLVKTDNELPCIHKETGFLVDLQWELGSIFFGKKMDIHLLLEESEKIEISGKEFHIPGGASMVLYLCAHGAEHAWQSLEHVCCLAEYISSKQMINWRKVMDVAESWGVERLLLVGLFLARNLYGVQFPVNTMATMNDFSYCMSLSEEIVVSILSMDSVELNAKERMRVSYIHVQLQPTILKKCRYIVQLLFSPTRYDWQICPLPANLAFMQWILRPARLLIRLARNDVSKN
jgi:hypothetical protein